MGRPRDKHYWNQVTKEENGMLKCKRCGHKFKGGVSRIKAHVDRDKGKGITICNPSRVTDNNGVDDSIMAGSNDPLEVVNGTNSLEAGGDSMTNSYFEDSMNQQNDAGPSNIMDETGLAHVEDVVGSGNNGFENEINEIQELVDNLSCKEDDIKEKSEWLEYRGKKCDRQVDDWLKEVGDLKKRVHEMIDSFFQGELTNMEEEIEGLKGNLWLKILEQPFLELSDKPMDCYFKEMKKLLRDGQVFFIGIHGMGGVGKTWLVTHFKNQITRKGTPNFENVFWVTVSNDFSIFRLQNRITKRIGIKLDDDDEITERAEILSSALEKKDRSVLILDDVWNYIDLQKVGILLRMNGIKLILTSRLKHVFQQMDCPPNNIIQMESFFDDEDAWELFLLKLGRHGMPAILPCEVEDIARSIVDKCNSLPLGICVMARTMKGVNNIHIWRHTLSKLENSAMGEEMEKEVIKVLKLSYDYLMDNDIQNCFLQCALYNRVSAREFIMNLVDEGLIKSRGSLEEIFDDGQAILDKLNGHSLLLRVEYEEDDYYLKMHSLVRDMANYIVKGRYIVKCNKGLEKIPDMQEWAPYLEKVSLMKNDIKEILEGTSPRCLRLSSLIFSHNKLSHVPNCFFNHMKALSILDLSYNKELTRLPSSLSTLSSLKSLLLKRCSSLEYVPPLGELQELSRLIISCTSIEQVPEGLAMLVKLKWLDLSYNTKLRFVPWSMLPSLTNMQYLNLCQTYVTGEVENVQGMSVLEYFVGGFKVGKKSVDFVENILDRGSGPKYYRIFLGNGCGAGEPGFFQEDRRCVGFEDCEALDHLLLPRDLHRLRISENEQWSGGICDALSFKASSSLRRIDVRQCPKLERLFCLSGSCSLCKHLQNLHFVCLYKLERLDVIWNENDEGICLPKLSHLRIIECHRMEKLLTLASLVQIPNLETIEVRDCNSMKEIFAIRSREDDYIPSIITLPISFKKLTLHNLPQLMRMSRRVILSRSGTTIDIVNCPNL